MLQIFFADPKFSSYASNDFAIWTESSVLKLSKFHIDNTNYDISYGGHYGPTFAAYFLQQNAAIKAGTLTGTIINLKTLGIGNGLTVSHMMIIITHICNTLLTK